MAYDDQKEKFGQEPVYYIEIELGFCSNDFGVAPCTATASAGEECFNCFNNCQDIPNFDETNPSAGTTTKIYRFSSTRMDGIQGTSSSTFVKDESPTFPTLKAVKLAPSRLTPGKGLGVRSSCSISLTDHPWTDIGIDPYVDTRNYDPDTQGTFWGKLLSRNPFYEQRKITVYSGFLTDDGQWDASNFTSRLYFIDSITGPDKNGNVQIKGKDILKFADSVKAQLPSQSNAVLSADITESTTSIAINDPSDDVKGAYDSGQTYIRVDDETMNITAVSGSNPSYLLTVQRATLPSYYPGPMVAEEHEKDATVQQCHNFQGERIDDVVEYLLDDVAGIDPVYLPTTDWADVIDYGLQSYDFSTLITEPTGVKTLLEEVTQHTIMLWWDERDKEVKMDSLLLRNSVSQIYNDTEHIIADSVKVARDDSARSSQVWMPLGHRNPVLDMSELKNFSTVEITADLELEGVNAYDQKRVNRIVSRWLPKSESAVGGEITARLNNYYKITKRVVSFSVNAKDSDLWTGDIIQIQTRQVQDDFGADEVLLYRILQANEKLMPGKTEYQYIAQDLGASVRIGKIAPSGYTTLYPAASDSDKENYFFIGGDDGEIGTGDNAYLIQ